MKNKILVKFKDQNSILLYIQEKIKSRVPCIARKVTTLNNYMYLGIKITKFEILRIKLIAKLN